MEATEIFKKFINKKMIKIPIEKGKNSFLEILNKIK